MWCWWGGRNAPLSYHLVTLRLEYCSGVFKQRLTLRKRLKKLRNWIALGPPPSHWVGNCIALAERADVLFRPRHNFNQNPMRNQQLQNAMG